MSSSRQSDVRLDPALFDQAELEQVGGLPTDEEAVAGASVEATHPVSGASAARASVVEPRAVRKDGRLTYRVRDADEGPPRMDDPETAPIVAHTVLRPGTRWRDPGMAEDIATNRIQLWIVAD